MTKKKKKKAQLPFRLNILFFVVFLLFSILILQLGVVQILNGEDFQEKVNRTVKETTKIPVPRGKMYDRYQNVMVDNKPLYAITYTPAKGVTAQDRLEVAEKLSQYISMYNEENKEEVLESITLRNKKEYWYLKHKDEAMSRLSKKEMEEMDNGEEYNTVLDRITEEEVSGFTEQQLEVILIKRELDKAMTLTPQIVKNENVTPEEYARVAEHLGELPGINVTTDWKRTYPYEDTLRSLLGSVTSQSEGILAEKEEYYLTRGYSPNDRVGKTGLEEQYESVLRGRKEQILYTTNKEGKVVGTDVVVDGQSGKDLVLSIDMELQKRVDNIVREEMKAAIERDPSGNRYLEDAMVVMLKPKTGEILAISGQHYNRKENKFENTAYKALYDAHLPGSAIKGATILAGLDSGVIEPGQVFYDAPIKIAGSEEKSSWKNLGPVNDITALQKSSNVYMFYIAMRMAGDYHYTRGDSLDYHHELKPYQTMRNYFHQFGLGVNTGIDYPFEATGFVGENDPKTFLNIAIGQYDTYTTMQLAQYVATIANDGYRVRPHFVKGIRMPTPEDDQLGPVYRTINTEVLNKIEMKESYIDRVQKGFHWAFQKPGGTAYSYFADKPYDPAGKTGTAENSVNGDYTENHNLVGYAPYDNPEVAFAIVVPNGAPGGNINNLIGERILDAYFELKKERSTSQQDNNE